MLHQEYPLVDAFPNSHYLFAWQCTDILRGHVLSFSIFKSILNFQLTVIGPLGGNGTFAQRPAAAVTEEGAGHVPIQPLRMVARPAKDPASS